MDTDPINIFPSSIAHTDTPSIAIALPRWTSCECPSRTSHSLTSVSTETISTLTEPRVPVAVAHVRAFHMPRMGRVVGRRVVGPRSRRGAQSQGTVRPREPIITNTRFINTLRDVFRTRAVAGTHFSVVEADGAGYRGCDEQDYMEPPSALGHRRGSSARGDGVSCPGVGLASRLPLELSTAARSRPRSLLFPGGFFATVRRRMLVGVGRERRQRLVAAAPKPSPHGPGARRPASELSQGIAEPSAAARCIGKAAAKIVQTLLQSLQSDCQICKRRGPGTTSPQ